MKINDSCPCGSGNAYRVCCGPYLDQAHLPDTAQKLMRSRYTAYVLQREDYLLQTWHPSTRPEQFSLDRETPAKWLGLKIVRSEAGDLQDQQGLVEFIARYKMGGTAQRLHETSCFVREESRWFYLDGQIAPAQPKQEQQRD